ncbi:uncharacterized protein LOC117282080 [Cryptotermes secundus]|uniref:uncharacterized protein LOC117282080 n=1 Tax=Cryptotermes secundus TaxID=105785 RepID=UPI001454C74C|nr:uncharacterized protein LOC117282080 [Cryptotermes secundus]
MTQSETSERRFSVFRVMFYLTGNPILTAATSRAYVMYSFAVVTCVSITSVTMALEPLMNLSDLEHCMQSARVVVPMLICIWIHVLRFKKRQLARLLALTESCSWSGLPTRDPSRGTLTMAGRIPLIQRLTWQSCVLIMASHTVHQIHRLITTKDRPLVFNAWFPFDTRESPVFELIYISQARQRFAACIIVGSGSLGKSFLEAIRN